MANLSIIPGDEKKEALLMPLRGSETVDVAYRINLFNAWLQQSENSLLDLDMGEFRDDLLTQGYAVRTVQATLSTVRERIRELCRNNKFVTGIKTMLWQRNPEKSPAELELEIQGILRQMENAADARNSRLKDTVVQDKADEERFWLTEGMDLELLEMVGEGKPELMGLRDRAIIALFLATGIRREELCNLIISDIFTHYQKEPALLVREGKGNKQRMVIYGALWDRYIEPYVDPWIKIVDAYSGAEAPLFQGFYRGAKKLSRRRLDPATINKMLGEMTFDIDGREIHIKPHDLRRTYARMLFEEYQMSVTGIQQQMGHADQRTTLDYIGTVDVSFRIP